MSTEIKSEVPIIENIAPNDTKIKTIDQEEEE